MKLIIKRNGICNIIDNLNEEDIKNTGLICEADFPSGGHKCWTECDDFLNKKCDKIYDKIKKTIDNYEFITDGYQIFDDNGAMIYFYVKNCNNCKKIDREPMDYHEIKRRRDNFRLIYFGTDNLEQAILLQDDLEKKGDIVNIHGKRPSSEVIKSLRKKYEYQHYSK